MCNSNVNCGEKLHFVESRWCLPWKRSKKRTEFNSKGNSHRHEGEFNWMSALCTANMWVRMQSNEILELEMNGKHFEQWFFSRIRSSQFFWSPWRAPASVAIWVGFQLAREFNTIGQKEKKTIRLPNMLNVVSFFSLKNQNNFTFNSQNETTKHTI